MTRLAGGPPAMPAPGALSNEHRLLVLGHLVTANELPAGGLVARVGLSQSALSQQLARLREEGLVAFRRETQTLFDRVADLRAAQVLQLLRDIFCPDPGAAGRYGQSRMAPASPGGENQARGD